MSSTLHFCRDGVLRRTCTAWNSNASEGDGSQIPVQAWEKVNAGIFLTTLHDRIVLETGITVGEIFENLAPWADIMTGVACMDFPAFLKEARAATEDPDQECDHIRLTYVVDLSAVPAYERPANKDRDPDNILDIGPRKKTGRLDINMGWQMDAILKPEARQTYADAESVSLSFSPVSEWKDLPVQIETVGLLRDETPYDGNHAFLGTNKSVTRPDHQNVEVAKTASGTILAHNLKIDAPSPTFFEALIRGLLWEIGFHYSPAGRDDVKDSVLGAVDELFAQGETKDEKNQPADDGEIDLDADDEIDFDEDRTMTPEELAQSEAFSDELDKRHEAASQALADAEAAAEAAYLKKLRDAAGELGLETRPLPAASQD
jgi:hypothetical protein